MFAAVTKPSHVSLRAAGFYALLALLGVLDVSAWGIDALRELQLPRFPATAQILVDHQPATGVDVVLHSLDGLKLQPAGCSQANRQVDFATLALFQGVPSGDYAVTVRWEKPQISGEDYAPGPNLLPVVFANQHTTPLRLRVSDVQSSPNVINVPTCNCAGGDVPNAFNQGASHASQKL